MTLQEQRVIDVASQIESLLSETTTEEQQLTSSDDRARLLALLDSLCAAVDDLRDSAA